MPVAKEILDEIALSEGEYAQIVEGLDREPNPLELGMLGPSGASTAATSTPDPCWDYCLLPVLECSSRPARRTPAQWTSAADLPWCSRSSPTTIPQQWNLSRVLPREWAA